MSYAQREVTYRRKWGLCSCFFGEFSESCVIHADGFEKRAYTDHYWYQIDGYYYWYDDDGNNGTRYLQYSGGTRLQCLLCGYVAFENEVLFATCQKRELE